MLYMAIFAAMVTTAPSRMKAQDQGVPVNQAAMQRAQGKYQADLLRQQIARDRSGVVADLMSRWAAQIGDTEKGRVGFETRFMTADPETLLKMSQAATWDDLVNASLGLTPGVNLFGDKTQDLVFNPITPCRVLDTRFGSGPWAGPYSSTQSVSFYVTDALNANGHAQGGAASCGFPFGVGTGVALNVTVVGTGPGAAGGDVKIFPFAGTVPNSSIVNFNSGTNTANAADVAIANANFTNDVTIEVEFAANINLVVDIMGYYSAPHATAVDTIVVDSAATPVTNGTALDLFSPACPAGRTLTGGGYSFTGPTANVWIWQSGPFSTSPPTTWEVKGQNVSGTTATFTVSGLCTRTAGR
jgi:hypothetical protein